MKNSQKIWDAVGFYSLVKKIKQLPIDVGAGASLNLNTLEILDKYFMK